MILAFSKPDDRRGAMVVFIAVLLTAFFVAVALSVDIAYMQLARTELRTATDAAARAGVEALSRTQDDKLALRAALDVAAKNKVGGTDFALAESDVVFGAITIETSGRMTFRPGEQPFSACRVNGRKTTDAPAGAVNLFFGRSMGTPFFTPQETAVASQLDRDICIVLDRSGSMAWKMTSDTYPKKYDECTLAHRTQSRWGQLITAVSAFIDEISTTIQEEQVGLVTFSSDYTRCRVTVPQSEIDVPLTTSYADITAAIETRTSTMPIIGGTSISGGLDDAVTVLTDPTRARRYALKTVILLTDGVHNNGRSPTLSAQDAAKANIVVHTIVYGPSNVESEMRAIAEATGGNYYRAPDDVTLRAIFREIALTVPVVLTE